MSIEDGRARYAALVQIVTEQIAQGKPARREWLDEIAKVSALHPEWATWSPPPPVAAPLLPAPPLPPLPPPSSPPAAPPRAAVRFQQERVEITVDEDIERAVREVLTVWGGQFAVFHAAGKLFEIQIDKSGDLPFLIHPPANPRLIMVSASRARALASRECTFAQEKVAKDGTESSTPCLPPEWLGVSIVTRPDFPNIPPLSALAQAPTLRADGGLIHEYGYDSSTGIYLARDFKISVPEIPSQADATYAMQELFGLVSDFDFVNDASKSVWLAGLLTATCRHTFSGPAPLSIMDASRRGAGKTTLVDVISIIATGAKAPRMFYTDDDNEMDKRITALALSGEQIVLIDNITTRLASPPLDAALTSDSYRGRVLGKSEMTPAVPLKIVWFATGNGMSLGADTTRRSLMTRLEPTVERPEDRTGPRPGETWKHPNLLQHVTTERTRYLTHALTIVRAYIMKGKPKQTLRPMGSFEGWSDIIRSAIVWAGGCDPCATVALVREADPYDLALTRFLQCWPVANDVTVTAASLIQWAEVMQPLGMDGQKREKFEKERVLREMWREALLELLPAKHKDLPTARELGYVLRNIKGSIIGNFKIESDEPQKSGVPWRRVQVWGLNEKIDTDHGSQKPSSISVIK